MLYPLNGPKLAITVQTTELEVRRTKGQAVTKLRPTLAPGVVTRF